MARRSSLCSRLMLVLGGLLFLAGLGWGLWSRFRSPPAPAMTDAGAVVLAKGALPRTINIPTLTPSAGTGASAELPTPALLPEWEAEKQEMPPTVKPKASPPPPSSPTQTPTLPPAAAQPPTRIIGPAIELDAEVVPMSWEMVDQKGTLVPVWVIPENAAGWHVNSALPGRGDNVVLSGHHNIKGKVFRHVVDLQPGNVIMLYVGDTPYTYIVTEKYILKEAGMPLSVRQENARWIRPSGDERLTLVTCWPYEWPGNTHRVIVVARPLNPSPEESDSIQ